jgi:DNA polymerase I-like protein with 3'-5' exonuclease and polymerase domains
VSASAHTNGRFFASESKAAQYYLTRGLAPVPLAGRTKKVTFDGWPEYRADPDDLGRFDGNNIGLLWGAPSAGTYDVDLDCPEAIAAADPLLPITGLVFGRKSAPRSHRLYTCETEPAYLALTDPVATDDRKRMLVELRNTGKQTMVPPSLHPDTGERVEWFTLDRPEAVEAAALERGVRRVAAAALLARYWPKGGRHYTSLALAGGLLRAWGYDVGRVKSFVCAVARAAGDDEVEDRLRAVEDTAEQLAAGKEKVTGWPTVVKHLGTVGQAVVDKVAEWCGIKLVFDGQAGKSRVGSEGSVVGSGPAARKARPLPPWVPFPTALLPQVLAKYVRETATAMDCDEAYPAGAVIAAVSMAVGCTHMISPKRGWREPCAAWIVLIGPSSTTKSPPYRDVEDMCQDINDRLEKEYEQKKAEYEQKVEEWVAKRDAGDDPGEKPKEPALRSFIKSDVTIPALVPELKVNPRGLLIGRDELIAWIGNFTRHSGKTGATELQDWLQLSNAGTVDVIRKTDKFRIRVRGVAVGVMGTTQPGVIAKALTPELKLAGLFARLLPLFPPVRRRKWTDAEVGEDTRKGVTDLLDRLFALELGDWGDGRPKPHLVILSPDAKRRFIEFYNRNGEVMFTADDDHRAAMGKIEGYALRFALMFHCCRHPETPADVPVSGDDMSNAVKLADWFIGESERVYQMLGETEEERTTRTLADQIHRKAAKLGGRISVKQLQNSNSRKYVTKQLAEQDLQLLVDAGFGTWTPPESTGKGGHAVAYYVPGDPLPTTDPSDPRPGGGDEGTTDPHPEPDDGEDDATDITETAECDYDEQPETTPEQGSEGSVVGSGSNAQKSPPTGGARELEVGGRESEPARGFKWASELSGPGYEVVTTQAGMNDAWEAVRASERVGLDLETTGLNPHTDRVRLLSLSTERGVFLIDCFAVDPTPLFEPLAETEIVGHNLVFDLSFLARLGFTPGKTYDTMLASQVLDAGTTPPLKHGLKEAAERHLGRVVDKAAQKSRWAGELSAAQLAYAAADAELPLALADALTPKLAEAKLGPVVDLEGRALPAVVWMASRGVAFDRTAWEALAVAAEAEAAGLVERMNELAPGARNLFGTDARNWNSTPQVIAAFAALGVELASTDDDALATADHPLASLLRAYRGAVKRAGTYGRAWLTHAAADGRVYPGWRQIGAERTGRMSCAEPNAQNLPRDKRYRECFVAPPGRVLVKADYSQIELRIAARIANEPAMLAAYRDGKDLHAETAKAILGKAAVDKADRQLAKAINFGLLYGMGAESLTVYAESNYGVTLTAVEAARYRQSFFRAYPALARWHRAAGDFTKDTRTVLGRRRRKVGKFTERLNSPVQGTAGDGIKQALALLWERRSECPTAFPVLAVHDEIVVECDRDDADRVSTWLKGCMKDGMQPFADPVPVEVEVSVGPTWGG